jgi:hypothetical protein
VSGASAPTLAPTTQVATSVATTVGAESTTSAAASTIAPETTASPATAPPTTDDSWRQDVAAVCNAHLAAGGRPPAEFPAIGIVEHVAQFRDRWEVLPPFDQVAWPSELHTAPSDVAAVWTQADTVLADAEKAAAADDPGKALPLLQQWGALLEHAAALVTVAGVPCGGDPVRAANAALNVPIPRVHQVATGFGSVWAMGGADDTLVRRLDPESGEVEATIDVGSAPSKAQPANGRMILRTADAYVAIDPATNTVAATLPKSIVGPAANISWAVDEALWICDGQRLHRYDPATFEHTGVTIELGIDCGFVHATDELVVAWNYNQDPGESGISAAVFIDPTTNQVLATVDLPADVDVPIVLDDTVFFPGQMSNLNAVVDRTTWTVTATPEYGREIGSGSSAYDGRSIYVIADGKDVLVIDARTYELIDVIEPLTIFDHLNAVTVGPEALWVATGDAGILQRFDIAT